MHRWDWCYPVAVERVNQDPHPGTTAPEQGGVGLIYCATCGKLLWIAMRGGIGFTHDTPSGVLGSGRELAAAKARIPSLEPRQCVILLEILAKLRAYFMTELPYACWSGVQRAEHPCIVLEVGVAHSRANAATPGVRGCEEAKQTKELHWMAGKVFVAKSWSVLDASSFEIDLKAPFLVNGVDTEASVGPAPCREQNAATNIFC
jgi:hypothetical protein